MHLLIHCFEECLTATNVDLNIRFKMAAAKGGMPKKRLHFIEGGQYGDREEYINALVRKMN